MNLSQVSKWRHIRSGWFIQEGVFSHIVGNRETYQANYPAESRGVTGSQYYDTNKRT